VLQLSLLVETLVASWRAAPAARRAALEQRRFPVHDGGCLAFRVPREWREEIALASSVSSVVFRPAARRRNLLRISMQPLSARESASFSIEGMRTEVERAASSAPGEPQMEPLAGRFGGGFHFCAVQVANGRRIFRTQGMFLVKPVLLQFRIETSRAENGLRRAALELICSARPSSG